MTTKYTDLLTDEEIKDLDLSPSRIACDKRNKECAIAVLLRVFEVIKHKPHHFDISKYHPEEVALIKRAFSLSGWAVGRGTTDDENHISFFEAV